MEITFKITDKERLELMKALDEKNQKSIEDWQQKREVKKGVISGLLIHVGEKDNDFSLVTVSGSGRFSKALGYPDVHFSSRNIGGKRYAIVHGAGLAVYPDTGNSETLYKSRVVPSCFNVLSQPGIIFGSVIICNFDETDELGGLASLTDEDVRHISKFIRVASLRRQIEKEKDVLEIRSFLMGLRY